MTRTTELQNAALRVARLLREEVIPRLPQEEEPENGAVPDDVSAALAEAYHALSAEPTAALASLFRAAGERAEESEETEAALTPSAARASDVGARAIKVRPGVRIGPTGKLLLRILEHYPKKGEIAITSAYRPGPGSHHGGLSYKGSPTAALDIGGGGLSPVGSRRMRDVARWLYDRFAGDTVELIHTTPYTNDRGFYVKNQRKYPGGGPYGPKTRREHRDHVHFATSKALALEILARLQEPRSRTRVEAHAPEAVA